MCDVTMALALAATAVSAAGSIQQGKAAAASSRYNAQVQDMNAELAERRARDSIERGKVEEQRKRQEIGRISGEQRAAFAANGVDLSFGSPLDTIVDTAVMGELDALTIRSNAYREAYDHRVDAVNRRSGATMDRMAARNAKTAGYMEAAGTVLGGTSKAMGDYRSSVGTIQ